MRGFISKIFDWIEAPADNASPTNLFAAGAILLIVAYLWHTVIKGME